MDPTAKNSRSAHRNNSASSFVRRVVVLALACSWLVAHAAESGRFIGSVVVEWLDDPFVHKMQLVGDFGFEDESGKIWLARKGHNLDGGAFPPVARMIVGPPYAGEFRRASVVYEYYTRVMTEPWQAVHRMLYRASLAEGMDEIDAKILYTVAYAAASRWETKESSLCFASCHAAAPSLAWRPGVSETELANWVDWTRRTNPSLDDIDTYLNSVIRKPGPHLFVQR